MKGWPEKKVKKINLIAIIGQSASGKDTIFQKIKENEKIHKVIHYTSRPKRPLEKNGREYFFKLADYFVKNEKEFFSIVEYNNWFYGLGKDSFDAERVNIGVFNLKELRILLENENFDIEVIEVKAHGRDRLIRSLERLQSFDGIDEVIRRYYADKREFSEDWVKTVFKRSFNNIETQDSQIIANYILNLAKKNWTKLVQ